MNTTTQGIDRDKAIAAAARAIGMVDGPTTIGSLEAATAAADAVLALVRPVDTAAVYNHGYVDGAYKADENLRKRRVILTQEEARLLVSTLQRTDEWHAVHFAPLAARLEAAQ